MQWKPQICLFFNIWKRKELHKICVVLQTWRLISHILACVGLWLPKNILLPSKFFGGSCMGGKGQEHRKGNCPLPSFSRRPWFGNELPSWHTGQFATSAIKLASVSSLLFLHSNFLSLGSVRDFTVSALSLLIWHTGVFLEIRTPETVFLRQWWRRW